MVNTPSVYGRRQENRSSDQHWLKLSLFGFFSADTGLFPPSIEGIMVGM
jgi:hypothetical protein